MIPQILKRLFLISCRFVFYHTLNDLRKYLHFYIGCSTNQGLFVGIRKDILFIQTHQDSIEEYDIKALGNTLFLYLQQLSDLSMEQSKQLIENGLVIGRPHGYAFTNQAFLYLISVSVDLFGLVNAGYAKDIKSLS